MLINVSDACAEHILEFLEMRSDEGSDTCSYPASDMYNEFVRALQKEKDNIENVLENLRTSIKDAEQFGTVRTEDGYVITGTINVYNKITLTEN